MVCCLCGQAEQDTELYDKASVMHVMYVIVFGDDAKSVNVDSERLTAVS